MGAGSSSGLDPDECDSEVDRGFPPKELLKRQEEIQWESKDTEEKFDILHHENPAAFETDSGESAPHMRDIEEILEPLGKEETRSVFASIQAAGGISKWFLDKRENAEYYLGFAKARYLGTQDTTSYTNFFLERSRDQGNDESGCVGPGNVSVHFSHEHISQLLKEMPQKMGTNNDNGEWERKGALGDHLLNGSVWPEVKPHRIVLGQTQENHAWLRPLFTEMVGPNGNWTQEEIRTECTSFFNTDRIINEYYAKFYITKILHRIHLNMQLSDEEAADFVDIQGKYPVPALLPSGAINNWLVNILLDKFEISPAKVNARKEVWLNRYVEALPGSIFSDRSKEWNMEQKIRLASGCFDSLALAGGLSVPAAASMAIAIASDPKCVDLPEFVLSEGNSLSVAWEVIRRFPPVTGFNLWEKSTGKHNLLSLSMAQRDQKIWGENSDKFDPTRSIEDYHKYAKVGWAYPALDGDPNSSEDSVWGASNSFACPALDLSFQLIHGITEVMAKEQYNLIQIGDEEVVLNSFGIKSTFGLLQKKYVRNFKLISARNLVDSDWAGKSDPFIVLRVGEKGSSWEEKGTHVKSKRLRTEWKSSAKNNTLNPEWEGDSEVSNDPSSYSGIMSLSGLKHPELHIRVYDDDWFKDDFLGEAVVENFDETGSQESIRTYILQNVSSQESTISLKWWQP